MNRLVLTLAEAAQFHAGMLTEIRRPVEDPPRFWSFMDGLDGVAYPTGYKAVRPSPDGLFIWSVDCRNPQPARTAPLGQPGETLWVAEEWGAGSRPDPFEGWRDGIEYRADEAYLDDVELLPLHAVTLPEDVEDLSEWMGEGWQSANTMPQWASRANARLTSVRAERTGDLWEFVYGVEKVDPPAA